jgi:transcriptional regulator with XRE-family HTH domain
MVPKPKVDLIAIGARIKRLRADVRQDELSDYLGVSQGHLSKIERGKIAPSLDMLLMMSVKFHKTLDWIIRGDGG